MASTAHLATVLLFVVLTTLVKGQRLTNDSCEDSSPSCPAWKDYCDDQHKNVLIHCRVTCDTCGVDFSEVVSSNVQRVTEQERRSRLSQRRRGGRRREEDRRRGSRRGHGLGEPRRQVVGGTGHSTREELLRARQEEAARREEEARERRRVYEAKLEERQRLIAEREKLRNQQSRRREEANRGEERNEATRREAARREAERIEAERREAARREAERRGGRRNEAARREAARREAARREAARREAARREAARREAERREAERREAERREAARREAARREEERRRNNRGREDRRRRPDPDRQTDCRDDSAACPTWRRFCTDRYTNVLKTCRKTCGICHDDSGDNTPTVDLFDRPLQGCKDDYPACGHWGKFCTQEYSNVLKYCRATCGTCHQDGERAGRLVRTNTREREIPRHMVNAASVRRRGERRRLTPTVVQRTYRRHGNRRLLNYRDQRNDAPTRPGRLGALRAPDIIRQPAETVDVRGSAVTYRRHDPRRAPQAGTQWERRDPDTSSQSERRYPDSISQWDSAASLSSPDFVKISLSQPQTSSEVRENRAKSPYIDRYRGEK